MYLPTKDGGFVRKNVSKLTPKEKEFAEQTAAFDCRNEADKTLYQQLAKELLFSA